MTQDTVTQPEPTTQPAEPVQPKYEDYWGVQEVKRFDLPDGHQYFDIRPMDEGAKTKFQKLTNRGIRMNQKSQDAHIDTDPSDERHQLILASVVGWRIMQKAQDGTWSELPCPTDETLRARVLRQQILEKFNPKAIQDLEFYIRKSNPWMQDDMDLESLYEERDRIDGLIKDAKEREAGEDSSATK